MEFQLSGIGNAPTYIIHFLSEIIVAITITIIHYFSNNHFLPQNPEYVIKNFYYNFKSEHSLVNSLRPRSGGSLYFPCLPYLKIYVYLLMRDIKLNSNFTTNDERYWFLFETIAL